eukprot:3290754-Heterocapsa_arctica.AAC.1
MSLRVRWRQPGPAPTASKPRKHPKSDVDRKRTNDRQQRGAAGGVPGVVPGGAGQCGGPRAVVV